MLFGQFAAAGQRDALLLQVLAGPTVRLKSTAPTTTHTFEAVSSDEEAFFSVSLGFIVAGNKP
jgi:hypothetical protein